MKKRNEPLATAVAGSSAELRHFMLFERLMYGKEKHGPTD